MIAIKNAELVLRDHYLPDAVLFIEKDKIVGFGEMRKTPIPKDIEVIDAKGQYVIPGFVDIHTHAYDGIWFQDDPVTAAKNALKFGTTTVLAALYFSADKKTLLKQIQLVKKGMKDKAAKNLYGLYMEAPYMNPKFGCDRENNPWNGPIRSEDYMELIKAGGDAIKVFVTAPERKGIEKFVRDAKTALPHVRFTVGHSEASAEEIERLIPYGLCIGTHHTNSTGTLPKYPECRGICVDEVVQYRKDLYAEIISDSRGIHVDPYMQRLVRQIKGDDKIILISDACMYYGPVPKDGDYDGVTDICFDFAGEIAGSKLTLNVAARNFMKHTGASMVEVMKMASYNPAEALGLTDRGEIAVGKKADLVIVDNKMNIKKVIFNGQVQ